LIYISGPITHNANYVEQFDNAAASIGVEECFNPADVAREHEEYTYEQYMQYAFKSIDKSDKILMLSVWESSNGAKEELRYAKRLGIEVIYQGEF